MDKTRFQQFMNANDFTSGELARMKELLADFDPANPEGSVKLEARLELREIMKAQLERKVKKIRELKGG